MDLSGTARLFACHALWRFARLRPAGRAVVTALGSKDPTVRTIAGMFLVKSGNRSLPLLREALEGGKNLPMVLAVLGDVGDRETEELLSPFSQDADPKVAQAAQDALRSLRARFQSDASR